MLARIITDCALANYTVSDWMGIPDRDWLQLLREAKSNVRLWQNLHRIFEQRRYGLTDIDKIIAGHRRECAEVLEWFRGSHRGDYLGTVPRDILGMIEFYLRVRIRTNTSKNGREPKFKFSYYVMSKQEPYDGLPETVYMTCYDRDSMWSCQIKWPGELSWYRGYGPRIIYPKVDREPCIVYEQSLANQARSSLARSDIAKCESLAVMHRDMC